MTFEEMNPSQKLNRKPLPKATNAFDFDEERLGDMYNRMICAGYTPEAAEEEINITRDEQWRTYQIKERYSVSGGASPVDLKQRKIDRVDVRVEERVTDFKEDSRWGRTHEAFKRVAQEKGLQIQAVRDASEAASTFGDWIQAVSYDCVMEEWIPGGDKGGEEFGAVTVIYGSDGNLKSLDNTIQETFDKAEIDQYVAHALECRNNLSKLKLTIIDGYVSMRSVETTPFERIRRITGYLVGDMGRWNDAKTAEEQERVKHGFPTSLSDQAQDMRLAARGQEKNPASGRTCPQL